MMHCHVSVEVACRFLFPPYTDRPPRRLCVVACPCCNWDKKQRTLFHTEPIATYDDPSMLSPKRTIRVWRVDDPATSLPIAAWDAEEAVRIEAFKHEQRQRKALGQLHKIERRAKAKQLAEEARSTSS